MESVNFPSEFMDAAGSSDFPSNAEIAKDVPFKVLQLEEVNGGKEMIIMLRIRERTVVTAWTTKIIKENHLNAQVMEKKEDDEKVENCYFKIICK